MLLGSSQHLPPPVLVIPSPSDVLLLGTGMGSPSGEWVGAVSVCWHITQQAPHLLVDLAVSSQLGLELGLVLPSHQHWVALRPPHWMVHWLSALDQPCPEMPRTELEAAAFRYQVSIMLLSTIRHFLQSQWLGCHTEIWLCCVDLVRPFYYGNTFAASTV